MAVSAAITRSDLVRGSKRQAAGVLRVVAAMIRGVGMLVMVSCV